MSGIATCLSVAQSVTPVRGNPACSLAIKVSIRDRYSILGHALTCKIGQWCYWSFAQWLKIWVSLNPGYVTLGSNQSCPNFCFLMCKIGNFNSIYLKELWWKFDKSTYMKLLKQCVVHKCYPRERYLYFSAFSDRTGWGSSFPSVSAHAIFNPIMQLCSVLMA